MPNRKRCRWLLLRLLLPSVLLFFGCGQSDSIDSRFSEPSRTFKTHQDALAAGELDLAWECYSADFRERSLGGGDFERWAQRMRERNLSAELSLEIIEERMINDRIGYLQFDPSTLTSTQTSPFFYFVREQDRWKITSYLDSLYHSELERAIANGQYKLPFSD